VHAKTHNKTRSNQHTRTVPFHSAMQRRKGGSKQKGDRRLGVTKTKKYKGKGKREVGELSGNIWWSRDRGRIILVQFKEEAGAMESEQTKSHPRNGGVKNLIINRQFAKPAHEPERKGESTWKMARDG